MCVCVWVMLNEGRVATRALDGDRRWVVEACTWRAAGRERTRADVSVRLDDMRRCVLVDPDYRDNASDPIDFDVGVPTPSLLSSLMADKGHWMT